MDEKVVRCQARRKLKTGALPRQPEQKLWVGPGAGRLCTVCGKPRKRSEMAYETELRYGADVKAMRFHRPCYGIWDEERTRLRVMGVGGASRQTCEWLLTSYKVGGKT
jgi:hypothetical protein